MAFSWFKKQRVKFRVYLFDCKHYHMYMGLNVSSYVKDTRVAVFRASHPFVYRFIDQFIKVEDLFREYVGWPAGRYISHIQEWWRNGPYRLTITSLNRKDYHDQDQVLIHAMFQCLVDYVELEAPAEAWEQFEQRGIERKPNRRYPEISVAHLSAYPTLGENRNILFLYEWWTKVASNRRDTYYEPSYELRQKLIPETSYWVLNNNYEEFMTAEEQEMIALLLKVRPYLWI